MNRYNEWDDKYNGIKLSSWISNKPSEQKNEVIKKQNSNQWLLSKHTNRCNLKQLKK